MQVLFAACICLAVGLGIWVLFSNSWVIFEDEMLDLHHGLFEICLQRKISETGKHVVEEICRTFDLDSKYYISTPAVLIIIAWVIVIFFILAAIFLRLIGFRKFGLTSMGIMHMLSGILMMTASGIMITSPLFKDDETIFRKDFSILITPKKIVGSAFYMGWTSGLLFFCSGLVAIALINRKVLRKRRKRRKLNR